MANNEIKLEPVQKFRNIEVKRISLKYKFNVRKLCEI